MSLKKNSKVAVIGSGISSLTYAYFLSRLRPDVKITVFEETDRPSGYIKSHHHEYQDESIVLQKGPRTLRSISPGTLIILDLVKNLGLQDEVKYIKSSDVSNKKWLVSKNGKDLIQLPNSFNSFVKFYLNDFIDLTKIFWSVFKEPFVAKKSHSNDESIHEFFSRRFTPLVTNKFLSAVYRGIYAGDVKELSVDSVMPTVTKLEQEYGSIIKAAFMKSSNEPLLSQSLLNYGSAFEVKESEFLSTKDKLKNVPMLAFSKGLASFTLGLHNYLDNLSNVSFKLNNPVNSIIPKDNRFLINHNEEFDYIRSSINSNNLLQILNVSKPQFNLNYVDIYMVNVYTPRNDLKINGFGYLVPQIAENKEELLGCIFDSDIEKNSSYLYTDQKSIDKPYTKLTLMFGGHQWFGKNIPSDEEMLKRTHQVLKRHLGITVQHTDIIDHTYIPKCIPQFEKEYKTKKEEFHKWLISEYNGQIIQGGMSFGDGCGVPDVVMNSFNDAYDCK